MKYRKKPVVIEALELRWDNWCEMCDHAGVGKLEDGKPQGTYLDENNQPVECHIDGKIGLMIPTLEGLMIASEGDYIIRGVENELYPCKPKIFHMTYEPVND